MNPDGRLTRTLRTHSSATTLAEDVASSAGMPIASVSRFLSRIGHSSYLQFFDGNALNDDVTEGLVATVSRDGLNGVNDPT